MVSSDNSTQKGGDNLPSVPTAQTMSLKEFDTTMVHIRTSLFTEKELAELKGYLLNENGAVPSRKAIGDLFNLSRDLVQKMAYQVREAKGEWTKAQMQMMEKDAEIESLKKEIAQLREEKNSHVMAEHNSTAPLLSEMGLDSVDLAKAICYKSKENGHVLYKNQMQTMLYILYGKILVLEDSRVTKEHPQMWEFGPVFPRVYSRIKTTSEESYKEQYEALRSSNPEVSDLLDETVSRCSWRTCKELLAHITREGSPWDTARKRNPEKKTAFAEDSEIKAWFAALR